MPLGDVSIMLDGANATFAAGQTVTGCVSIRPSAALRNVRILLIREWRTRGVGTPETGSRQEMQIVSDLNLDAGQTSAHPFSFTAPDAPFSYQGRLFNLAWKVIARVQADLGEAMGETEFRLVPGDGTARTAFEWEFNRPRTRKPRTYPYPPTRRLVWVVAVIGVLFLIGGALLSGLAVMTASRDAIQPLIVGVIVLAFGALCVWQAVAESYIRRTVGSIALTVGTPIVRPTDTLRVSLEVPATHGHRIASARLFLVFEEECVMDDPADKAVRRWIVRELEIAKSAAPPAPGQPLRLQAATRVPSGAQPSFHARCSSLNWVVEARLSMPLAPDFRTRAAFIVAP